MAGKEAGILHAHIYIAKKVGKMKSLCRGTVERKCGKAEGAMS